MLFEFIQTHRAELIARTRRKVAARSLPRPTELELESGVPLFLDQLIETLRVSRSTNEDLTRSAGIHGRALLRSGFTVAQVVHDYGDICQAVTELAVETEAQITVDEFRTLNRCLDDAIAQAVTEYTAQRERAIAEEGTERMDALVEEIRTRLSTAKLSFELLKQGHVGVSGATGAILGRNLRLVCNLIDRSFAEVRLASSNRQPERVLVSQLFDQLEMDAAVEASSRGLALSFNSGEPGLYVKVDRQLIIAALGHLLQNAFSFTRKDGRVSLAMSSSKQHIFLEIADECGGLPAGKAEVLLLPTRHGDGLRVGVGLDIVRRSVEACGGQLRVRDVPGSGCVFTIELPRQPAAA
jgi:signal transduction histidine kinase